jgi:serine/threonine protein kinase
VVVDADETVSGTEPEHAPTSPPGRPGDDDELRPTTLIDRYQIERRLGAGGMGVVYAARDIHLGRAVAVKVVGPRIDTGSGQGRLVREAQAMARLRHANLATVYDIGVSNDRLFVVMELIDGGTVADWLASEPRSWRAILAVYLQAARGLAAAHAAGFVHRDFKPENVLLDKDGVARVSDFGVARILGDADRADPAEGMAATGSVTGIGVVVGTPGYIAPEILRHEPVDGRADQFSFCVAVYASVYGERPFEPLEGPSRIAETLGKLRPPRDGIAPRWLQRIITRGLAADPRDRWPTMDALAAAIARRLGRRRRTLALTGVGVIAVAAMAVAMVTRSTPAPSTDWSPVVIGRESKDAPLGMAVSRDGSTLVSISPTEAWVEPRDGAGTRRRIPFPFPAHVVMCRLSRTGDQLFCSVDVGLGGVEIWVVEVATGQAERRVPPIATPTVKPSTLFDVGADGSILFGVGDFAAVWRVDPAGAVQHLVTAQPGEMLTGGVWSPDGTRIALKVRYRDGARIEVMTVGTGTATVVSHRICKDLEWLTENSLACAPRTYRNPVVIELLLPAGGGEATERVRYKGPEYQQLSGLSASSDGVLFSTSPNDKHLGLLALDSPGNVRRIASGGVTDLPAAGWTSSGSLIFGASVQGHLRIMALHPDGRVDTVRTGPAAEVPLVVLGETIVFGRFPGGESTIPFFDTPFGRKYPDGELFRLTLPGGAVEPLGRTRGFSELLCAGGRATPCLLVERSEADAIAIDWDVETGARGRERARWPMTSYASSSALSPDGRTLAQVRRVPGRGELSLLDLDSGARRRILVSGTSLDFPRWQPDGTLLAMGASAEGRGLVRVGGPEKVDSVAVVPARDEQLTAAEEFQVTSDGKTAAILMTESLQTHWWVPSPDRAASP